MEVIIHKEMASLDEIFPKWEQLHKEFQDITVFQNIEWIKCWWDYKKKEREINPYIVEVKKGNETIGIIPLYRYVKEFAGFSFRVLKPIGIDQSDYLIPILSKNYSPTDIVKRAMEKIYTDKNNWDCLDWGDIPEGSVFDLAFKNELIERPKLSERKEDNVCPYLLLNQDIEKVSEKFNNKFYKEILYYDRRLKREGEFKFHKVQKESDIEPIMNRFFELHLKRWRNTSTPSKFEDIKEREFAMQAAKGLFKNNLLYLAYLTHNDDFIVVHFGMADGRKNYLYLHAMNIEYKKYPCGHLFAYYLILDSCKENYEVVDFLRGDEGYKNNWGTTNKFNVKYLFFSNSIRSLLFKMVNNTYYSKQFQNKSLAWRLLMKTVIRSGVFVLGTKGKLKQTFG